MLPVVSKKKIKHKAGEKTRSRHKMKIMRQRHDYLPCIMSNSKISARKLWFNKTLIVFKGLIQLLGKCFMRWLRKHAAQNIQTDVSKLINCKSFLLTTTGSLKHAVDWINKKPISPSRGNNWGHPRSIGQ